MTPFEQYRTFLLNEHDPAVESLRDLTLALHNSHAYQWRARDLSDYDSNHLEVAWQLMASFQRHGDEDPSFREIAAEIVVQRRRALEQAIATVKQDAVRVREAIATLSAQAEKHDGNELLAERNRELLELETELGIMNERLEKLV
ncbi:hypothetical protein C7446_1576 [Kushneria sinocarnis]|uniref:Uncharacterized protein n=1 Tax=Kushneria sinocarnis TaxID=595502 RepID=A0A420WX89_9GAMM|nr:hypothetical protein [Kushneria sinocarnis]RKR04369.1 hypothetical protein C7446_1576 [Kushneria sinocarnis]